MTTESKSDLVSRKPDALEKAFGLKSLEEMPATLAAALLDLARLAEQMRPDDVALTLDMAAGVLSFRACRRERR